MKIIYSNNEFHSENFALLGWLFPDLKTELKQKILDRIGEVLKKHGHSLEIKDISVGNITPNKDKMTAYYHSVTAGIDDNDWRYVTFYTKWENKMPCIKSILKVCEKVMRG